MGNVEDELQHIISPPMNMEGIGILRPSWEAPLNCATSRGSTDHMGRAILGGVEFYPTTHSLNILYVHNPGKARKVEVYGSHYVEVLEVFNEEKQIVMY